jgi:hypothetical protein
MAVLWGCASSEQIVLSEPMVTSPVSYTDEISRRLATGTFQRLPELYEDYRVGAEDVLEVSIFEWERREEKILSTFVRPRCAEHSCTPMIS